MPNEEPTPRQLWVLIVYIETGSRRAAAERLGVSEDTVRNTLAAIRHRLRVDTSVQAFAVAVRDGLIDASQMDIRQAA
jgi:DNA-binding NarL/FixJ family response regulator